MLGKLAIGFDFNVRSWHRADKLPDLKVRYEREAEKCSGRLYTDLGIRACSIRDAQKLAQELFLKIHIFQSRTGIKTAPR